CRGCGEPGHIERNCPLKAGTCLSCGQLGHRRIDCPFSAEQCHRCNRRGHKAAECTERYNAKLHSDCMDCAGGSHHANEYGKLNRVYCYNCASTAHFGDDCP
ncbi:hypothetical protein GQ42DRAFT_103994, partial [Ramicandelaber brevisporus]